MESIDIFTTKLYTLNLNPYKHVIFSVQNLSVQNKYPLSLLLFPLHESLSIMNPWYKLLIDSFISRFFGYVTAPLHSVK
jgi:hypothetical protein